MVDEYFVARLHFFEELDCCRIGDAVPSGCAVLGELFDGVSAWFGFGQKVDHTDSLLWLAVEGCFVAGEAVFVGVADFAAADSELELRFAAGRDLFTSFGAIAREFGWIF